MTIKASPGQSPGAEPGEAPGVEGALASLKAGKLYKVVPLHRFANGMLRPEPLDIFVMLPASHGEYGWFPDAEPDYIQAGAVVMALGPRFKDEAVCLWGDRAIIVLKSYLEEV